MGIVGRESLRQLVTLIGKKDLSGALEGLNELSAQGKDVKQVLLEVTEYLRALLLYKTQIKYDDIYLTDTEDAFKIIAPLYTQERILAATKRLHGLDVEVDMEKSRKPTRDMVIMPVNVNFFHKAFFHTDKVMKNAKDFKPRVLTEQDKEALTALGIVPDPVYDKPGKASYDRVILIVFESVHRDYINYYNPNIPKEVTPFLNGLLDKYKKLNNYYSSAVPTTQGLNATFRSQLIYDGDLPGEKQGSIYRTAQQAGWKGIFLNASSRYYNKEYLEYPRQFGMATSRQLLP